MRFHRRRPSSVKSTVRLEPKDPGGDRPWDGPAVLVSVAWIAFLVSLLAPAADSWMLIPPFHYTPVWALFLMSARAIPTPDLSTAPLIGLCAAGACFLFGPVLAFPHVESWKRAASASTGLGLLAVWAMPIVRAIWPVAIRANLLWGYYLLAGACTLMCVAVEWRQVSPRNGDGGRGFPVVPMRAQSHRPSPPGDTATGHDPEG